MSRACRIAHPGVLGVRGANVGKGGGGVISHPTGPSTRLEARAVSLIWMGPGETTNPSVLVSDPCYHEAQHR